MKLVFVQNKYLLFFIYTNVIDVNRRAAAKLLISESKLRQDIIMGSPYSPAAYLFVYTIVWLSLNPT